VSTDIIDMITTIPLWVVVIVRAYRWPEAPGKRAILATFFALAVGATLRLSVFEEALAALFGNPDTAELPKHISVMVACACLVGWVESIVPPREQEPVWRKWITVRPRQVILAVACFGATVVFPFSAPGIIAPDGSRDYISAQYGNWAGTTHLALYLLTMGAALAPSALLCWTVARRTTDRLFRICMRLMAAGAAVGAIYPLYRLSYLVCGFADWSYPLPEGVFHLGGSLIQMATLLLVMAGSSVRLAEQSRRIRKRRRGILALRPLWEDMVSVLPQNVISERLKSVPSRREERYNIRDLYGRLDTRIVDISDGSFELLPWISADLYQAALAQARAAGLHGREARAAREALCLRVARAKATDGEPFADEPAHQVLSLRNCIALNTHWLTRVAHHYTSPQLDDAVTALTDHTPQKVAA
jgi:hypothetical protein